MAIVNTKTNIPTNRPTIPIDMYASTYFFRFIDRTTAEPFTRFSINLDPAGAEPSFKHVDSLSAFIGVKF